jgi:hypothetical protein
MNYKIQKLLTALLLPTLFACSNFTNATKSIHQDIIIVDNHNSTWTYAPTGSQSSVNIEMSKSLVKQVPQSTPCCRGTYEGRIKTDEISTLGNLSQNQLGILFPPIGGLTRLRINHQEYFLEPSEYSVLGPLISLDKAKYSDTDELIIEIAVDTFRGSYAGMWFGNITIGQVNNLLHLQNHQLIHQSLIPGAFSLCCLVVACIFLFLILVTKTKNTVYRKFMAMLFAWSTFFFFLAGNARRISFYWGSLLHYPVRTVVAITVIRLVAYFSKMPERQINTLTLLCIPVLVTQLVASFLHYVQ